ncbi:hypothetical protein [Streptomyces sp. AGS-58]|uniref:hypothetical protein n=1 Tax=unclassified Streptomyces TaxID=2593676 RepID=UPI0035A3835E
MVHVFDVRLEVLTYTFRTALYVVPFIVHHATKRACLGLQAADRRRLLEGRATGEVRRGPEGGYQEARTLLPASEAYRILVRGVPRPRAHGTEVWRWFHKHRIRNAPSRWYFGKRVELPATEGQLHRVQVVRAAPGKAEESDG